MYHIDGWRILMILPMTAPYYTPDGDEQGAAGFYIAACRDVSGMDPLARVFITAKLASLHDDPMDWIEVTPRVSEDHAVAHALRAAGWNGIEKALMATR